MKDNPPNQAGETLDLAVEALDIAIPVTVGGLVIFAANRTKHRPSKRIVAAGLPSRCLRVMPAATNHNVGCPTLCLDLAEESPATTFLAPRGLAAHSGSNKD
ncbi:hypothetical protein E2562_007569 [Oryza meyeriana var. granulata]|uniref:Uncharacterized protein n=1 Tax=Oryza meyeriana var. granulata TaxID=110450 RepID=A0A6G1DV38_9ORYZ|nr:hypothetical protein E2562_007569 [Oryza meyeriana var. granulata]